MDLAEILAAAQRAVARGESARFIDTVVDEQTKGAFRNLARLQEHLTPTTTPTGGAPLSSATPLGGEEAEIERALLRTNERGGGAGSDFAASAAQGATLGGADELAGLVGGADAQAASRQATADRRLLNPGSTLAAELAGGILIPAFGAEALAARLGGGLLGTLGAGAITGAVTGGAVGGLESEGSFTERLPGVAQGTAIGAATGAVAGPLFSALLGLPAGFARVARRVSGADQVFRPGAAVINPTVRVQREAAVQINKNLSRAGVTAEGKALQQAVADLGPAGMVADLSDPIKQNLRDAITDAPGLSATAIDAAGVRSTVPPPIKRLTDRPKGRGRRMRDGLREGAPEDLRNMDFELMRDNAISNRKTVGEEVYGPLETEFTDIRDPAILDAIVRPEIREIAESSGVKFKDLKSGATEIGTISFRSAQQIRQKLNDIHSATKTLAFDGEQAFGNLGVWDNALDAAIPPEGARLGYRQANEQVFQSRRFVETLEEGRKAALKEAPEARLDRIGAVEGIRNPAAAVQADLNFRSGMLHKFETKLLKDARGGAVATDLMQMPEDFQRRLGMLGTEGNEFRVGPVAKAARIEEGFIGTGTVSTAGSQTDRNIARRASTESVGRGLGLGRGAIGVLDAIVSKIPGALTKTELEQVAFLVGRALLSGGEEAANRMAFNITNRSVRISQSVGILGSGAARAAATQEDRPFSAGRGGLLRIQSPGRR